MFLYVLIFRNTKIMPMFWGFSIIISHIQKLPIPKGREKWPPKVAIYASLSNFESLPWKLDNSYYHWWFFVPSPWCVKTCSVTSCFLENCFPHCSQGNGFIFKWEILMCIWRVEAFVNCLLQYSQNNLDPVARGPL